MSRLVIKKDQNYLCTHTKQENIQDKCPKNEVIKLSNKNVDCIIDNTYCCNTHRNMPHVILALVTMVIMVTMKHSNITHKLCVQNIIKKK